MSIHSVNGEMLQVRARLHFDDCLFESLAGCGLARFPQDSLLIPCYRETLCKLWAEFDHLEALCAKFPVNFPVPRKSAASRDWNNPLYVAISPG
jgi:hypothetical protein